MGLTLSTRSAKTGSFMEELGACRYVVFVKLAVMERKEEESEAEKIRGFERGSLCARPCWAR